jgi:hypothetical protein
LLHINIGQEKRLKLGDFFGSWRHYISPIGIKSGVGKIEEMDPVYVASAGRPLWVYWRRSLLTSPQ